MISPAFWADLVPRAIALVCLGLLALTIPTRLALANPVSTDNVTAYLVPERGAVTPGEKIELALVLDIRPGWHTYWQNPGDSGEPTRIAWRLPEGVQAGPIRWPSPQLIRVGPLANYGYSGRAVHLVRLDVPPNWPAGRTLDLAAEASWLVCEAHCIPESAELAVSISTGRATRPQGPDFGDLFVPTRQRLPQALDGQAVLSTTEDGNLRLAVDGGHLPGIPSDVWFFPTEWGLIDHAAEQPWRLDRGQLMVDLTGGPAATQASPAGVLVVRWESGVATYALTPERAAVPLAAGAEGGAGSELGLAVALGMALLGGLILNLMPCVFPVLAMKVLALTGHDEEGLRGRPIQGMAYTAGVLVFFALVGTLLLGLRAGGESLGWGYQLQYSPFVALMAYVFFVLGLSLLGAITLGTRIMGLGCHGPSAGARGAFITGALAALVAAPCTAPFMGAALGYAVTLTWPLALAVMLTLGLGLALPYLIFSLTPQAVKFLPKPGRWMENLKEFLAFPMFATAAWLLWVLSAQTGTGGVGVWLTGLLLLALALWVWERTREGAAGWRKAGSIIATAGVAGALALAISLDRLPSTPNPQVAGGTQQIAGLSAEPFSLQRLVAARGSGRPVFVNMTASWCITCLVNERIALRSTAVARAFSDAGVIYLKGDWTNRDPVITNYLGRFGRNGVPLYVYYPVNGQPRVLPQILTEALVLDVVAVDST